MDSGNSLGHGPVVGSAAWFHSAKGLNNYGYRPGFPRSDPHHLPASLVSEQDCRARWDRVAAGFRYASEGREESPTMQDRIEELFAITHQRPIGSTKTIGVAFARGILAEKMGFAVNWAEFARKQCQRRHATYEPLRESVTIKYAAEEQTRYWIFDEATKKTEYRLHGCVEDWTVNNKYKDPRKQHTVEDFDFRASFDMYPSQVIERPLYKRLKLWQGRKSEDNEKGTSSETSGPVISGSHSGAVNQVVSGTGLESSREGLDSRKGIATHEDPIGDVHPKDDDSPLLSWKTATSTILHRAYVSAMETIVAPADSVSVNRGEDDGKATVGPQYMAKRRLLNDTQDYEVTLPYPVTGDGHTKDVDAGKELMLLAVGSSCESSSTVHFNVDHSPMTSPSQGAAKKPRN